jgi:K+-sensing histidine kinase KdpD
MFCGPTAEEKGNTSHTAGDYQVSPVPNQAPAPGIVDNARKPLDDHLFGALAVGDPSGIIHALLQRCAGAVNAGAAFLVVHRRPGVIDVVSPGWRAEHAPVEDIAGQSFDIEDDSDAGLIDALGLPGAVARSLDSGPRRVGTLVLAAKTSGTFTADDARRLVALAPSAAVVADMALRLRAANTGMDRLHRQAELCVELVGAVSHDLRTPLTSIVGVLQTLARTDMAPTNPDAVALLNSALNQAERLRSLIEDLLMSPGDGMQPTPIEAIILKNIIVQAINAAGIERHEVDVPESLPTVFLDAHHLRRVLVAILEDAASREGEVIVTANISDDALVISVEVSPPGSHATPSARLALALRLVEAMEGTLHVQDGAVELRFPLRSVAELAGLA